MFEDINFSNENILIGVVFYVFMVSVFVIFLAKCFSPPTFNEIVFPPKKKEG